ncbi:hypothetical protein B0H13DRAFT_1927546 [Mycena leptocephala]|nr:hypothetical protein B0H13DRAFT_1927546 [Mycena leptocephala]
MRDGSSHQDATMDLQPFTFNFRVPLVPPRPKSPAAAFPALSSMFPASNSGAPAPAAPVTSGHAASQARYRTKNAESEKVKARERMRRLRENREAIADARTQRLQKLSSDGLRRSKTFAAFREYVREHMFWVAVDDDNPEEVAAYDQFIKNNTPNRAGQTLSDDDLEFLFRHISPMPESIDDDDDIEDDSELNPEVAKKLEMKRVRARERMARRRAAIKVMPPEAQEQLTARARASRAKYREQHRLLLLQKERSRRQKQSSYSAEEYLRRLRVRESRPSYRNYQRVSAPHLSPYHNPPPPPFVLYPPPPPPLVL